MCVGDVVVSTDTGDTSTAVNNWTYFTPGRIDTVSPSSGQHGVFVTITGSQWLISDDAVDAVTLAGVQARVLSQGSNFTVVAAAEDPSLPSGECVASLLRFCTRIHRAVSYNLLLDRLSGLNVR